MEDALEYLAGLDVARCYLFTDKSSGLRAVLVIDDVTLGPAAGGIRTWTYPTLVDALTDAAHLARAMTLKCSLAGLNAGGGKLVVLRDALKDRSAAFETLGARIEELGGLFRTAGDLGTGSNDLESMGRTTQYVNLEDGTLAAAVGESVFRAMEACIEIHGRGDISGLRVAVQGCGAIGRAVARRLADAGMQLVVADVDGERAREVAEAVHARVLAPDEILGADVDLLCPCAVGGCITVDVADHMRAWAVCGAANNMIADELAERRLSDRGILFVPDFISSAGAVIEGLGRSLADTPDPARLIERVKQTTLRVLESAKTSGRLPSQVAADHALTRIRQAKGKHPVEVPRLKFSGS